MTSLTILHSVSHQQGNHQLLCGVACHGRYARRPCGDDLQRIRRAVRPLVLWAAGLRPVEQLGRLLLFGEHSEPVLHLGGPILCDRQAAGLSADYDAVTSKCCRPNSSTVALTNTRVSAGRLCACCSSCGRRRPSCHSCPSSWAGTPRRSTCSSSCCIRSSASSA